jgi:hypothetical protein
MGTEYLIIILLWCGDPGSTSSQYARVMECRKDAILCASQLKSFTTDDVIANCLVKPRGPK